MQLDGRAILAIFFILTGSVIEGTRQAKARKLEKKSYFDQFTEVIPVSEKQRSIKKQVHIIWGSIVAVVAAFLFPPREAYGGFGGFHFLSDSYAGRISTTFLLVEVFLVALVTAALVYTVRLSSSADT